MEQSEMKIRELIIENFKSYYGKHRIGIFDCKITSVVGPNGSGKSNLIESIIFVFGQRANLIRLKNL